MWIETRKEMIKKIVQLTIINYLVIFDSPIYLVLNALKKIVKFVICSVNFSYKNDDDVKRKIRK